VAASSQTQYQRGWNLFKEFSSLHNVDPYLMEPFEAWFTHGLDKLGLPYPVVALAAFIQWALLRKCPKSGKLLSPVTVDKYAFHVRHYLLHSGVSIEFFSHPILKGLRSSVVRQHRMCHSQRDSRRQAAPVQLVVVLRAQLLQAGTMLDTCLAVAAGVGFTGLHRYGQYLPSPSNHFIRAGDVMFEYTRLDDFGVRSVELIPPNLVHSIPKDRIVAVSYFVPHSKTDQLGTGVYNFVRRTVLSDTVVLDVVGDLYDWSCLVKPSGCEPLFSWNAGTCFPNKTAFNRAIKRAAVTVGLPSKGMSSHSLRIGGASTMFGAGMHGFEIKNKGDWKTLTFLVYLRTSVAACDKALLNLVNPNFFTIDDARRISRDSIPHKPY